MPLISVSRFDSIESITHAKISDLLASLPTSRQQVVFVLVVPNCQQVCNKLLTTCNKLDGIITLVARLFQQVQYSHDITILLQPCDVNPVTFLLYHDCIRLVRTTLSKLATLAVYGNIQQLFVCCFLAVKRII